MINIDPSACKHREVGVDFRQCESVTSRVVLEAGDHLFSSLFSPWSFYRPISRVT